MLRCEKCQHEDVSAKKYPCSKCDSVTNDLFEPKKQTTQNGTCIGRIDGGGTKYNKLANNDKTCYPEEAQQLATYLEEVQKYHELEQRLNGVDLTMLVNLWIEMVSEGEVQGYQRGRILTNDDAEQWDAYKEIGTPEECRAAVDKQKAKKPITYTGTNRADCPICLKTVRGVSNPFGEYCAGCGQKLDWGDEE